MTEEENKLIGNEYDVIVGGNKEDFVEAKIKKSPSESRREIMEFDRQNQELEKVKDSNDDEIKPNALVQDETEILEKGLEAQEESLQTEKVEET